METNIIAEFHIISLLFAKQELDLDNKRCSIFLNMLWILLMNQNEDYDIISKNIDKA